MNIEIHRRFDAGMTEQFLQHFGLHPVFDCTRCIGVAQSAHTEFFNSCFVAWLVKVDIIGTVFRWLSCSPVDKNKITHDKLRRNACTPVYVLKRFVQRRGLFLLRAAVPNTFQNFIGPIRQWYCAIALLYLRRSCTPEVLLVAVLQGFVDRQRPILEIYRIPRQSDHLAGAQTGFKDQRVLIVVVGAFRNFKKSDLLIPR